MAFFRIRNRWLKYGLRTAFSLAVFAFVFAISAYHIIERRSSSTYSSVEKIPNNKVGLVLGTSKFLKSGNLNPYYLNRIHAAYALFRAKKIKFILLSGDNGRRSYDEPTLMKEDLIALGVPEKRIYLDYAGFRTWDSMIRSKAVFGQTKMTVISQEFHNVRAIYIAEKHGILAIGFNAKSVKTGSGNTTPFREYFARVNVMLDVLFARDPKFYGEKIKID